MEYQIITRDEAREQGLNRYFSGKPCKNGHLCERNLYRACLECRRNPRKLKTKSEKLVTKRKNNKLWAAKYPDKVKAASKKWRQKNQYKKNADTARYRADKIKATPKWLTTKMVSQIEGVYKTCPKGHEVDHMVPLRSELVCGLHVPWNLQHLTKDENASKGNQWWPEMF